MNKDNILKVLTLMQCAKADDTFQHIPMGLGSQVNAAGDVCDGSSTLLTSPVFDYNSLVAAGHKANFLGLIAVSSYWQLDSGGKINTDFGYPISYVNSNGVPIMSRFYSVDTWLGITETSLSLLIQHRDIDLVISDLKSRLSATMLSNTLHQTTYSTKHLDSNVAVDKKSQLETDLLKMIQDAGSLENKELIRKGIVDSVQFMNVYQFIQSNKEELFNLGINLPTLSCWVSEIEWLEERLS